MKTLIMLLLATSAQANESYYLDTKPVTKLQAAQALLSNPNSQVTRCTPQELSPTLSMRNRPKVKAK